MRGAAKAAAAALACAALVAATVATSAGTQPADDGAGSAVEAAVTASEGAEVTVSGLDGTAMPRRLWEDAMTALEAAYEGTGAKGGEGTVATSSGDSSSGEVYVSMPDGSCALITYDSSDATPCRATRVDGVPKTARTAEGQDDGGDGSGSGSEKGAFGDGGSEKAGASEKGGTESTGKKNAAGGSEGGSSEKGSVKKAGSGKKAGKQAETAAERAAKLSGWTAVGSCGKLSEDAKRMVRAACEAQGGSGQVLVAGVSKSGGRYRMTARRGSLYMSVSYADGSDRVEVAVL